MIQHIGRWGSSTVERYVAHALEGRSSWATVVAAGALDMGKVLGEERDRQKPVEMQLLTSLVRQQVLSEVTRATNVAREAQKARADQLESSLEELRGVVRASTGSL